MDGETVRFETYMAYMLRLWQAGIRAGKPVWRASLENPHTGERLAFGDTKALFAFLAEAMNSLPETFDAPEAAVAAGVGGSASPPAADGDPAP